MRKQNRVVKWVGPGLPVGEWQRWDLSLGDLAPEAIPLTVPLYYIL